MHTEVKTPKSIKLQPRKVSRASIVGTTLPFLLFLAGYALAPKYADDRQLTMLMYIGIYALLALGLNLLMGYAGQISLGHAAFFGMGAYTSAIFAVRPIAGPVIPGLSTAVGVMFGCVLIISLTRLSGWRLAALIGALLASSWAIRATSLSLLPAIVVGGAVLGIVGFGVRTDWWRTALAGISAPFVGAAGSHYLYAVLARGGGSPWMGMLVGILFTSLVAYLIGSQVLRLKGHYLAMATLGFGIIVEIVFRQWTAVTGGSSDGIFGIPTIKVFDYLPGFVRSGFEALVGGQLTIRQEYFFLVWGFVFITLILGVNIVRSRVGRAFRAVHGSEAAAESLGVDTERYKVQVFVLSAALASLAGSLHAHNAGIGYIHPSDFSFIVSVQLVVMVVVGGMASIWGALFGATVIQLLKNWLLTIEKSQVHLFGLALKGLDPIVFGGVLIIVMIVLPQGAVRGLTDLALASLRAGRLAKKQEGPS